MPEKVDAQAFQPCRKQSSVSHIIKRSNALRQIHLRRLPAIGNRTRLLFKYALSTGLNASLREQTQAKRVKVCLRSSVLGTIRFQSGTDLVEGVANEFGAARRHISSYSAYCDVVCGGF